VHWRWDAEGQEPRARPALHGQHRGARHRHRGRGRGKDHPEEAELQRIAKLFDDWGPEVRDGAFWHEFSAPSAGPPPWDVYEIRPTTVYAVAGVEPHGATRWRL
jgi:hypothetical protein